MPRSRKSAAAALALAGVVLAPAALPCDGTVCWIVNGGFTPALGVTSDYLKAGWTLGTGIVIQPDSTGPFAFQADLAYSDFNATHKLIQLGQSQYFRTDGGRGDIWSLTVAGKFLFPYDTDGPHGYALLGLGAYHRYVELTQTALGTGFVCDPWWGYCYPGVAVGEVVVANRSNTKLGFNAGVGFEYTLDNDSAWFVEARFHWINGSKATEFIPIQIGYEF
jgi:hypothetical protein